VSDSRLVYSTDGGDQRKREPERRDADPDDGVVRVSRETSGRRGKGVTVVRGVPAAELATVGAELKKRCGAGGTVKDGMIEIQGEHRDTVVAPLPARGYRVKG
jgi:translation initiation factor 1